MMASVSYGPLVGAIDQGTSSTRFLVFASQTAELLAYYQSESEQIYPKEGWVEQNPLEILQAVELCIEKAVENLRDLNIDPSDIKAIGLSNQRETTILWDKFTGRPLYNAIVWLDSRTTTTVEHLIARTPGQNKEYFKPRCGLPLSPYFSAVKVRWLLDNVPEVAKAVEQGRCLFGTVDSWLLWNLTGGVHGGIHITDVTNASRTMLMDLDTQQWNVHLCRFFGISMSMLPAIRSCSEIYGYMCRGPLKRVPISGCLGDQSAALVGQMCLKMGQAKNTYGTGCFLLYNTGMQPVFSEHGLLTTVAYKLGKNKPTHFALEGSVAICGASVQWLRDKLGIIKEAAEIESLASSVESSHGTYFVPAFSGLYAPYWEPHARGLIIGLTQFTSKAHIARAALEAVCFQTREILEAMYKDSGICLQDLQVDGGMTENNLLMQLQSDLLGITVVRPSMLETTALGAAIAAGVAEGIDVWDLSVCDSSTLTTDKFTPQISENERNSYYVKWKNAVQRSMYWETIEDDDGEPQIPIDETYWRMRAVPGCLFVFSTFGLVVLAHLFTNR